MNVSCQRDDRTTLRVRVEPLRNRTDWSLGSNFWGRGGETIEVYPSF